VQRIASTSRKLRQEEDAVLVAGPDQGDE